MEISKNIDYLCNNGKAVNILQIGNKTWFKASDVLKATSSNYYTLENTCVTGKEVQKLSTANGSAYYVSCEGLLCMVPQEDYYQKARQIIAELIGKFYS